ncbi:Protein kinase dsk1 [Madurella mycetomatis]|uniref:Protein kinase dsk1 n=1 Tax=Madurella mycetomatis TaxID=100816 RepID=A0A175VVR1_9PEZI|nr:Protein kinase dsk1 [Madurella mycetomatis]
MINILDYTIGVPAEDLTKYCPGGYHPMSLNDRLHDGRYEIFHKLGFGSFSTVWLARDHHNERNVTIKVVVADRSVETARELTILRALKERGDPAHPGWKHVSHLLESFYHEGPNGRHLCIVLGLLGPKPTSIADRCPDYRLGGHLARSVSRQLLLAVDYLHATGVAHGDIHMGNVLFRLPEHEESLELVMKDLGPPQIGKVQRRDGAPLEPGVPEYLVEPADYNVKVQDRFTDVELIDFGESFFITDPPKQISTPVSLHPPELVFQHSLTSAVDLWNLGCTTYELVIGRTPFESDYNDKELVPQFEKVIGGFPAQWIQNAVDRGVMEKTPDNSSAEYFLPLEDELRRSYFEGHDAKTLPLREVEINTLGRYLRKLLVIDPTQRAKAHELLSDPWVSEESEIKGLAAATLPQPPKGNAKSPPAED